MNVPFVDLSRQLNDVRDMIYPELERICESGGFILGPDVKRFEQDFAAYIGVNSCVGCANGTDALELALEGLGVGKGDEVIVPAHTWISTASAVSRSGADIVFADSSSETYNIDLESTREKITDRTKAIIGVHLYGRPFEAVAMRSLADEHGIFLIEDTAQAHGASLNGVRAGSTGHVATFSFYPSKNLGCFGDGGCVVTKDLALEARIRSILNCGQLKKNEHLVIGRNSRMDALQAAVLCAKLPHLDKWNDSRIEAAKLYSSLLDPSFQVPLVKENERHIFHIYAIRSSNRDAMISYLGEHGIGAGIHYPKILPDLEVYKDHENSYGASDYVSELVSLPMFPYMKKEEVEYVAGVVNSFIPK